MTISEERYQECVQVTSRWPDDAPAEQCRLGAAGLVQAAHLLEAILICDGLAERERLCRQMGEVFWHYSLLLVGLDLTLQEVMAENLRQLCARFPHNGALHLLAARPPAIPGIPDDEDWAVIPRTPPEPTVPPHPTPHRKRR